MSYAAAASSPGGGHYVITYGAILYGAMRLHRGLRPSRSDDAVQLLDRAARLESVDRTQAVAAYEEIIRLFPETRASDEARRNIQTLACSKASTADAVAR